MTSPSPLLQLPNTYRAFFGAFAGLRPFQREVIGPILNGQDVILQAATGSGKTEAVLAPCLERVVRTAGAETVVYIVPTRALVHDLRRRFEPIIHERLELRLGIRTGDVKRLPAGQADMVLTTPESLDVMLGSSNPEVQTFLGRVRMVIVDEVHQLLYGYRGCHLAAVLQRLGQRNKDRLQKIALSATLAGPQAIRTRLGLQPNAVWISSPVQRPIQPHFIHLKREDEEIVAFLNDLAGRFGCRKVLLFANSRSRCDQLFALLSERGYFQPTTYLHYSNLNLRQRQEVERQLQRHSQALCIATSTLELGIDIGDVDTVVLYEPPESVSTFLQRLGRANRQAQTVSFWGICRGERAGEQLVQFLALCHLAQHGQIEQAEPNELSEPTAEGRLSQLSQLPSVLVQQVLSCLYERKQLSRATLATTFPTQARLLDILLPALEARRWLRAQVETSREVWRGGWRYARALRANQIWSNFPDTDEPYVLEVDEQAVADLPTALVRQMELGDRLNLAGRRIRILDIYDGGHGERKVVRATPTEATDLKELSWLGSGPPVSWEVAQAVRPLLHADHRLDSGLADGLFSRTRALLQDQRQAAERQVVLHNGLGLSRTSHGLYRYASYLGSIGNFIFARTVERYYSPLLEDFACSWDAFGIECSDCIDVQRLPLPVGREAFRRWAAQHLSAVQALLALNAFSRALPRELLIEEVSYFLWDERVSQAFATYRQRSSEIAHGDPRLLDWEAPVEPSQTESVMVFVRQGPQPTLLEHEAIRLGLAPDTEPVIPPTPVYNTNPRALTGTMLGSYIQHQQCERLLSFELLPFNAQPPKRSLVDSPLGALRAERGQEFESWVVDYLEQHGAVLVRIADTDEQGRRLSLQARQADTLACVSRLIHTAQAEASDHMLAYLVQPVLLLSGLIESDDQAVAGVGIPDLIEVSLVQDTVWLRVVDIKDSPSPRYSQKWQVAFYAALLDRWLQQHAFGVPVRLADTGVLLTRPTEPHSGPNRHGFALRPYLDAFPFLERRIVGLLNQPIAQAGWQLGAHCARCGYVESCYRQALSASDVRLLPHLSPGTLLKLQTAGLHTLPQLLAWSRANRAEHAEQPDQAAREEPQIGLSPQRALQLSAQVRSLVDNQILRLNLTTTLYPANVSTLVFVHLLQDPWTGRPRGWGVRRLGDHASPATVRCWIALNEADITTCQQAFIAQLRDWWREASGRDRGPHLVTFDSGSIALLREETAHTADPHALDFVWHAERPRYTELRQLMLGHFALPIPIGFGLETLAHVWGCCPEPASPLLQEAGFEDGSEEGPSEPNAEQVERLKDYVSTCLQLLQDVWQACTAHLRSDWRQTDWTLSSPNGDHGLEQASITFLEQQRDWRVRDIEAVQQLPLAERIERYRALGPLEFEEAKLDAEGRFVYHFRLPAQSQAVRFRAGDFLKLNPIGSPNLQAGFRVIIADYEPHVERLSLVARQGRIIVSKRLHYSLDEDVEDWTTARVMHAVHEVFVPGQHPELTALVTGRLAVQADVANPAGLAWVQAWAEQLALNTRQREALLVPFQSRLGLIEGPPGTGKTHLLAWMLIALITEAAQAGRPMRIAVSALTHQAIDNVLLKVRQLLCSDSPAIGKAFPAQCLKWGRRQGIEQKSEADCDATDGVGLSYVDRAEEVLPLAYLILGATGFGLYQLFDSQAGKFPAFFDWVIMDEASQMLLPQALLSLVYGKGKYVLCGDVQQLPPVILGPPEADAPEYPRRSILAHLLELYGSAVRVRLNETYRLNRELCALPSRLWYQNDLHPAAGNAGSRLQRPPIQQMDSADIVDKILDPERPVTLVLADHKTDHQQSTQEVEIIARLALRLLLDYGFTPDRLAIVSPHRAQNNAITQRLAGLIAQRQPDAESVMSLLPVIDTVERLQGAEREVILFSVTTSDPDQRENPFLNNPNRFNVAITRARHKLVVVGSRAFFSHVAHTEEALQANHCFKAYYQECQEAGAVFEVGREVVLEP